MRLTVIAAAALAAAFMTASSAAAAVTVINATSVLIKSAVPSFLQVAEVQAFSFGAVNVAAASNGGIATGSPPQGFLNPTPDRAIDGNTSGVYANMAMYHSAGSDSTQFLSVTFAAPTTLQSLTIFGRTDCCSNRDIYNVTIFNGAKALYSGQLDARGKSATVTFEAPSVVPEPASWAMMIAGFGLVGGAQRRRRTGATGGAARRRRMAAAC
jgi:hypothetical protein